MKRILISIAGMALAGSVALGYSQSQPSPTPAQPSGQKAPSNNQAAPNQPANNQSAQKPTPNGQSNPAAPAAHSKAQPQAKSQEEFNAYQAAVAKPDPSAMEMDANDFAKKYPGSELVVPLYSNVMQKYQNINNADKVLELGRKILQLDPENIPALALSAYVLAESTRETDLDRDQKYAEGLKNAQQVVKTINTALVVPPTITPEQLAELKGFLLSMAESSIGYIELSQKNYVSSEQDFKAAIDANKSPDSDPMTYLRLAIAQDNQKKYAEAMGNVDKAIHVAQSQNNSQVMNMAKNEKDRLSKLTAGPSQVAKPPVEKQ